MKYFEFQDKNGTFLIKNPENYSGLYFPLAGEQGLKSSITPNLGGDSKADQNHFLLEPVSIENLHNNKNGRNFWCRIEGKECWSACGVSAEQEYQKFTEAQEESVLEAGFMWQKVMRTSQKYGIKAVITSFVTIDGSMEVSMVELTNQTEKEMELTSIAAVPIYGRSADNLRDHRHVTSLLHRIHTTEYGVEVTPVLSFDERGHQKNDMTYFVYGSDANGSRPAAYYPTVEEFIGEGGSFLWPEAVRKEKEGRPAGACAEGKEACGGIRFEKIRLQPKETTGYIILTGMTNHKESVEEQTAHLRTIEQGKKEFEKTKNYWISKVNIAFEGSNADENNYLKWICFQPVLRRIYGCSFLPYHDYGKGGRGWRDLWQDCLALLLMNPSGVGQMIIDNYGGVRIDGTNATIIGSRQGEFIADRNNITRVWMDHAFWPFVTTKLYIDQTGDMEVLLKEVPYFKDLQTKRGTAHDNLWNEEYGKQQKTEAGVVYTGTILEHILLQNLCAFYDVGEHNEIKLHGADWNDALDMAWENGESVAFTCAYAGNMKDIADCLKRLEETAQIHEIEIAKEMKCLLAEGEDLYENVQEKRNLLKTYTESCAHNLSGEKVTVKTEDIIRNLEEKAEWMMEHIRKNEWICDGEDGWFNGYYDNHKNPVEGIKDGHVRMMLTGQVFAVMSGTAKPEQIQKICKSADKYLYDEKAGGYRLNTNFKEEKFDLGRMFGFAYGEKENGAVFSHMAVMYANALYKQGFIKEGHKALQSLMNAAMRFENSKMYPGIPEYFDNQGRGLYAYLTGAASWYMLTMLTQVYGVRGEYGDLVVEPALMPEQYDLDGSVSVCMEFAGKKLKIQIKNVQKKVVGAVVKAVVCDGYKLLIEAEEKNVKITRDQIKELSDGEEHLIEIILG